MTSHMPVAGILGFVCSLGLVGIVNIIVDNVEGVNSHDKTFNCRWNCFVEIKAEISAGSMYSTDSETHNK